MSEMKPCPFCGGKPRLQKYESGHDEPFVSWRVVCLGPDGGCFGTAGILEDEQQDAIDAWNTRTALT